MTPQPGWSGRWRWSLRRRLTVSAALATALVAVLLAVSMVGVAAYLLRRQVDDELSQRADQLVRELATTPVVLGSADSVVGEVDVSALGLRSESGPVISRVIDSFGRVELGSSLQSLPVSPADIAVAASGGERWADVDTATEHFRVYTRAVPVTTSTSADEPGSTAERGAGLAVQVASPVDEIDRALVILALVGVVAVFVGLGAAGVVSWWVSRSAIRPVDAFATTVEHVAATGDLSATVPTDGARELMRLGTSFNELMASLAASRDRQQQLIADAGHELRTPLTSIRTNLELLAEAERAEDPVAMPPAERAELLDEVHAQFEELTSLVTDVVALARDDARTEDSSEIRLDRVVEHAVERARRRAGAVRIDLTTEPAVLDAQATLLERAVLNVLDNAIKWSPANGVVSVRQRGGIIEIDDQGPGIAPEDRAHVFERFWRSPSARSVPGSGLGLAIVAQVVTNHGGTATVGDADGGGTRVRLALPATAISQVGPDGDPDSQVPFRFASGGSSDPATP